MGAALLSRHYRCPVNAQTYSLPERFVLVNRDDRDALNAVDALIFSMAAAELKVFDEDNREFIEMWKAIFISNLKTLLS